MKDSTSLSIGERLAVCGGVAAVVLEWFGFVLIYLILRSNFNPAKPMSYYSTLSSTHWAFVVCFGLAAISFWVFAHFHLSKYYTTPNRAFAISMASLFALAVIPYRIGDIYSTTLHKIFAIGFGLMFVVAIYAMYKHNTEPELRKKTFRVFVVLTVLFCLMILLQETAQMLVLEFIGCLVCQYWILYMTLHTFRTNLSKNGAVHRREIPT